MLDQILSSTTQIVTAFLSNHQTIPDNLPGLIRSVHATLTGVVNGAAVVEPTKSAPAVPVKKSVTDDYLICLEDGKRLKMLKRYLRSRHDMSPEQYRAKWGLPADYPMVALNYSKTRSDFAKSIGLGRSAVAAHDRKKK
jgi:predicted transcriptional regulator